MNNKDDKNKRVKNKRLLSTVVEEQVPMGGDLSFAASEAYKLLRTNLTFSVSGEKRCKVIGITSAIRGEGKSTTCINLAYTLAQSMNKVLLIDGDMRLPTIAKNLKLSRAPGLSNVLAGQTNGKIPIQESGIVKNLFVLSSGDIPPNPSELLASRNMEKLLELLGAESEGYDYIVIDLPPVNVVTDALVIANICDGMVMIVREEYTGRQDVEHAVAQLRYRDAKILGFVLTHSHIEDKTYRRSSRYYRRYSSRYYRRYGKYGYSNKYGYGYAHVSEEKAEKPEEKKKEPPPVQSKVIETAEKTEAAGKKSRKSSAKHLYSSKSNRAEAEKQKRANELSLDNEDIEERINQLKEKIAEAKKNR